MGDSDTKGVDQPTLHLAMDGRWVGWVPVPRVGAERGEPPAYRRMRLPLPRGASKEQAERALARELERGAFL